MVEWLRTQRNRPELMKYFRQEKEITPIQQAIWWNTIGSNPRKCRPFLINQVIDANVNYVGYAGFLPFQGFARRAEFGIFVIPEFQGQGIGKEALLLLLRNGFEKLGLVNIYSDVLDYPGENRFQFYKDLGFVANDAAYQTIQYRKNGVFVKAIKFYMTKEMWDKTHGNKRQDSVGSASTPAVAPEPVKAGKEGDRVPSGKANVKKVSR